jgi:hypothetical protein
MRAIHGETLADMLSRDAPANPQQTPGPRRQQQQGPHAPTCHHRDRVAPTIVDGVEVRNGQRPQQAKAIFVARRLRAPLTVPEAFDLASNLLGGVGRRKGEGLPIREGEDHPPVLPRHSEVRIQVRQRTQAEHRPSRVDQHGRQHVDARRERKPA